MNKNISTLILVLITGLLVPNTNYGIGHGGGGGHGYHGGGGHYGHGGHNYHGHGYYGRGYYDGGRWIAPAVLGTAALTTIAASANKPQVVVAQPSDEQETSKFKKRIKQLERENKDLRRQLTRLKRKSSV